MRQYPIYHDITACNYKSSKSYGSIADARTTVRVGTSKSNSEVLVRHRTTKTIDGDYTVFRFEVDGKTIKTKWMHTKTREWFDTCPAELETIPA